MSKLFVVIHEAQAVFTTATEIADRVLLAEVDWLDDAIIGSQRTWLAELPTGNRLRWSAIRDLALKVGIHVHGHFNNSEPALPDAKAARRAIHYVYYHMDHADVIMLVRDMDDQPAREAGLNQAKTLFARKLAIVIGAANCEREA